MDAIPGGALLAAAASADADARARAEKAALTIDDIDGEEQARAGVVVERIVLDLEMALRAAEPMLDVGIAGSSHDRIAAAGLLPVSGVGAAALARAADHRLHEALAGALERDEDAAPDPVEERFGEEAFALRLAEAARIDRSGDPILPLHDTPAEARHILFWQIAACLADATLATLGGAREGGEEAVHRAAAAAVARASATIDDGEGIAAAALRLAHALDDVGGLDDARLASALAAGRLPLLAGMLAVRGGVDFATAAAMARDVAPFALLLRGCGVSPPVAAAMILTLAFARGGPGDPASRAASLIEQFDALSEKRARAALRRRRLDPAYGDTLATIGGVG